MHILRQLFLFCLIGTTLTLTMTHRASAYPNFISYGYYSCMNCHYNPFGGGPLSDYGRAVAATEIASRYFVDDHITDEALGENSSFPAQSQLSDWIRPALNYRGLGLLQNLAGEHPNERFITMDLSGSIVAKFLPGDRLTFVTQMSFVPAPATVGASTNTKRYRSREFYAGYRATKTFGIYAGLMDKVFGVRVPDHIAYSRILTALTQNDQTHALLLHFVDTAIDIGIQPFIGNLVQQKSLRQKGISSLAEVTLNHSARIGASYLQSTSDFTTQQIIAAHLRTGTDQAASLLAEIGRSRRKIKQSSRESLNDYLFTQGQFKLGRGFWTLLTVEAKRNLDTPRNVTKRVGPGLQVFPRPNMELRADSYFTFQQESRKSSKPQVDLAAQLHLWL
ncbi:MAG: hypothetical protein FJ146_18960 [Deltaproteobacteria bacterium]|nr:hypothetical protein [Deltaproteobacteria bacterium]